LASDSGEVLNRFDLSPTAAGRDGVLIWTPDGKSLIYVDYASGVGNLWSQSVEGGPPKQFTNFKDNDVIRAAISPDGKSIAMVRAIQKSDVVLLRDFQ
jgi:Tol biopolymer transport system component